MGALVKRHTREIEVRFKRRAFDAEAVERKAPVGSWIAGIFKDLQDDIREKFIVVSFDERKRIRCFEVVAIGSLNVCYLRPMDVFRSPLLVNAAGFVMIHNHPSGEPEPSIEDIRFTRCCQSLAQGFGLELLDHVIIGYEKYYSFAGQGKL